MEPGQEELVGSTFAAGEARWRARLGTLRQVVRQELVSRQLAGHLASLPGQRVLDIGCGQGTQLLELARRGHVVTGLDDSAALLSDLGRSLRAELPEVRDRVRLVRADALRMTDLFEPANFDVVLCHGVLMYLPDPGALLGAIASVTAPGGIVSLLVRNGDALAMRPALAGDWQAADAAFGGVSYVNRIGVQARADRLNDLTADLGRHDLAVRAWYGVRVFTDRAADDAPVPDARQLSLILACEERAGRSDPYRAVAALLHLIAQRPPAGAAAGAA
jgi:S-adenosylmethionine-dependent methyltransferase